MAKLTSSNPAFVELFYGVVVGSAVAQLSIEKSEALAFQIAWLFAVLEDWYLYQRYVLDEVKQAVSYTFKSLTIEFLILSSWYLGFAALGNGDKRSLFFLCAASFYFFKVFGGIGFYFKHGELFSRRMLYDSIWIVPVCLGLYFSLRKPADLDCALLTFALITTVTIVIWWWLTKAFPHESRAAASEAPRR